MKSLTIVMSGLLAFAPPAAAADHPGDTRSVLAEIARCRTIAADAQRLACFDKAGGALDQAIARRDRFTLAPSDATAAEEAASAAQIDATLAGVSSDVNGTLTFALDNGSVWRQTDPIAFGRQPRPGDKVTIRRTALGRKLTLGRTTVHVIRVR